MTDIPTTKENANLMKNRKPLIISAIAAVTAIVLGLGGWLVYTNVKAAAELAEARETYETSLADLAVAQSEAEDAEDALAALLAELTDETEVAEQLVELLGEGNDT